MLALKNRLTALNQSNAATLGGSTALVAIIRFVSTSILTRILAPEAFAITVIIGSILTSVELMSDLGVRAFVIRDRDGEDDKTGDVVWTIEVIRGCCLSALIWVLAPGLADGFGNPDATNYIRVASIIPLVNGLRSLGEPLTSRAGLQRVNERIMVLRTLTGSLGTILFAIWLRDAWALVLGMTLGSFSHALIDYVAFRRHWRLKLHLDKSVVVRVLNFSKFLLLSGILTLIITQTDKLIVARNFPLEIVGLYGMALTVSGVVNTMIPSYSRRVFFPDIAQKIREETLDRNSLHAAMGNMPLLFFFLCGGAIGGGQIFFQIVYDERYLFAGTLFSITAAQGIVLVITELTSNTEMAYGNTRHSLEMSVLRLLWIAVTTPFAINEFGVLGLAAAFATRDIIPALVGLVRTQKRQLLVPSYYARGALAAGLGLMVGIVGTWLIKLAAAAFSIPL